MTRRRSSLTRPIELSLAAPAVIAMRTARMLAAGPNPGRADRREMTRMWTEKVQAFGEAWLAMALRQQRAQVEWSLAIARAAWSAWSWPMALAATSRRNATAASIARRWADAQHDVVARGIAPLHRVATANARRLSGRRR